MTHRRSIRYWICWIWSPKERKVWWIVFLKEIVSIQLTVESILVNLKWWSKKHCNNLFVLPPMGVLYMLLFIGLHNNTFRDLWSILLMQPCFHHLRLCYCVRLALFLVPLTVPSHSHIYFLLTDFLTHSVIPYPNYLHYIVTMFLGITVVTCSLHVRRVAGSNTGNKSRMTLVWTKASESVTVLKNEKSPKKRKIWWIFYRKLFLTFESLRVIKWWSITNEMRSVLVLWLGVVSLSHPLTHSSLLIINVKLYEF